MTEPTESRGFRDILKTARQDSRRKLVSRWLPKLCNTIVVVALLNFGLFLAGTIFVGGDAWNGKVEGQKYYVWGYHHGRKGYTEVSQAVFEYSKWHAFSVIVTWPLGMLAVVVSQRKGRHSES